VARNIYSYSTDREDPMAVRMSRSATSALPSGRDGDASSVPL